MREDQHTHTEDDAGHHAQAHAEGDHYDPDYVVEAPPRPDTWTWTCPNCGNGPWEMIYPWTPTVLCSDCDAVSQAQPTEHEEAARGET